VNKYLFLSLLFSFFILLAAQPAVVDNSSPHSSPSRENHINVYYFHTNYRCVTCKNIEKYTTEAIKTNFGQELAQGKLTFTTVNVDEDENKHFINDYKLYTKHVILSQMDKGKEVRWKNLDQVWVLVRSPGKFKEYIVKETQAFLEKLTRK
jgi:hypothetical protein